MAQRVFAPPGMQGRGSGPAQCSSLADVYRGLVSHLVSLSQPWVMDAFATPAAYAHGVDMAEIMPGAAGGKRGEQ